MTATRARRPTSEHRGAAEVKGRDSATHASRAKSKPCEPRPRRQRRDARAEFKAPHLIASSRLEQGCASGGDLSARRLSGATRRRQQHNYRDSCPVSHDRSDITARVAMVSVRVLTASRCWRRFQLLWQLATAEALHFKRFARSHDPQSALCRQKFTRMCEAVTADRFYIYRSQDGFSIHKVCDSELQRGLARIPVMPVVVQSRTAQRAVRLVKQHHSSGIKFRH